MEEELYFDLVWLFIAILIGFSLIFISSIYFNINSPFYTLQIQILEFIKVISNNLWKIIFSPFIVIFVISLIVIIYLILFFRAINQKYLD